MNYLKPKNCNKAKCKTCIFKTNGEQLHLSPERLNEIIDNVANFKASQICHTTNKTCYGGLELTAKKLYELGIISENSVNTMLEVAQFYI